MDWVSIHGRGLHSGKRCSIRLARSPSPVRFETQAGFITREALRVVRTDRGVAVASRDGKFEVDLVEHLFSALAGLGIQHGVALRVQGPEIPLADGGALEFAHALASLRVPETRPHLIVARRGRVRIGDSVYDFTPSDTGQVDVAVEVEFEGVGRQTARWNGSADDYLRRIAPARTFGFRRDYEELRASGRAAYVDTDAVLVLDDGSAEQSSDELARHKLLDLLGDAYFFEGPPVGSLRVSRPGHTATHAAFTEALDRGILLS